MAGRPPTGAVPRADVILDAAEAVFLERGYATATMDEIARRARASKATLYRLYPDKAAVLDAVVHGVVEQRRPDMSALSADAPPDVVLRSFAGDLLAALVAPKSLELFRLVIAESGRQPELGRTFYGHIHSAGADALAGYLEQQAARGILAVEHPQRAALQFLGMFKEVAFWPRLLGVEDLDPPARAAQEAVRVFLAACGWE